MEMKRRLANVTDDAIFQWLTSYYLHQDSLSWSRTQTILAVEAGVLAAAFYLDGRASVVPLVLGAAVIWFFWSLMNRDWEIRDQDLENQLDRVFKPRGIRVEKCESRWWRKGETVSKILIWATILANLALSLLFLVFGSRCFLKW